MFICWILFDAVSSLLLTLFSFLDQLEARSGDNIEAIRKKFKVQDIVYFLEVESRGSSTYQTRMSAQLDALSATRLPDGRIKVWIHVAGPTCFLQPWSIIDRLFSHLMLNSFNFSINNIVASGCGSYLLWTKPAKPWQGLPLPIDSRVRALFNASVLFNLGDGEKLSSGLIRGSRAATYVREPLIYSLFALGASSQSKKHSQTGDGQDTSADSSPPQH